jgi:ribosome assembly protein 4
MNVQKNAGGIAWAGSLVGSQNPNNLGYRYSHAHKRYKKSTDGEDDAEKELPSSVVVQFKNREGEEVGNLIDIPTNSDVDAMSSLVHALLNPEEEDEQNKTPYSFYAKVTRNGVEDDIEVTSTLANLIIEHDLGTEDVIALTYQPLAVFRVRPVTRCTDTMPGHTEAILHVSYSPDGRHLASGGGDTTVRFWDVNTCLPRFTCHGHRNHVLCTAWSPDGKRFASADKNGVLILWDPLKGKAVATIKAHSKHITSIAWEPMHKNKECDRLATASKDSLVKIWHARTQRCIATLAGHLDSVECVKW